MNRILYTLSMILVTVSCSNNQGLGEKVDTQHAISVKDALEQFKNGNSDKKVVFGRIKEVCQSEGCWFSFDLLEGPLVVDFNDKFTVPTTIAKQSIYATGNFYRDTLMSNDDSDNAVSEKITIKFRATGVSFK
jgi:hypothetical protein